jgi:hypothetical protein
MTTAADMFRLWRAAAGVLVGRNSPAGLPEDVRDRLFELQNQIREEVFADRVPERAGAREAEARFVLDALEVLSLTEADDPSHPWARGGFLAQLGRHLEAADDYLVAAERFEEEALAAGDTGDEADWARGARAHAARHLALGGQPIAAAALLASLDPEDRQEITGLVEDGLRRIEQAAG